MKMYIYRYGSICEPDMINAFKNLGFSVYEETIEIYNKTLLPSECVEHVSPKLINGEFSFVFSINFFPWLSDLCNIIHIPYLCLIVDSPVLELYSKSIDNEYNRIFLFDKALYNEFSRYNPKHIFHIPLSGAVIRMTNVIESASYDTLKKYSCDISFIGSTYEEKCPFNKAKLPPYEAGFADGIIEAQLKVYGYNFIQEVISDEFVDTLRKCTPEFYKFPAGFRADYKAVAAQLYLSVKVAEQERIRVLKALSERFNVDIYTGSPMDKLPAIHNCGFAKSIEEMPLIFNQSKINLNITAKSIRSGLSQRIFDVLACQGFLITNYQAELPEYFEIGKDLVTYESIEDLCDKCSYYLKHEDERIEIAKHGHETLKKFHTTNTRILQMLNIAF